MYRVRRTIAGISTGLLFTTQVLTGVSAQEMVQYPMDMSVGTSGEGEESTSSADVSIPESDTAATGTGFENMFIPSYTLSPVAQFDDISEVTPAALPGDTLATPTPAVPSASMYARPVMRALMKSTFRAGEPVIVIVEHALHTPVSVTLKDKNGTTLSVPVRVRSSGDTLIYELTPPASFRPGSYTVAVTDDRGNVSTGDFSWGVLALNTDRSRYSPGQTARVLLAVLDDAGYVDCDAHLTLIITTPGGDTLIRTTGDGSIRVTGMCYKKEVTTVPDYETSFPVGEPGAYILEVTAITKNGTHTVSDSIDAQDDIPFDIVRDAPTRIYPPNEYPVRMVVTALEDFRGTVIETVPESFAIRSLEDTESYKSVAVVSPGADTETIALAMPFEGGYGTTLGFGQSVLDPEQAELYRTFGLKGHDGVDFETPEGTPVLAVDGGTVMLAEDSTYGNTLIIRHAWGQSYYGHLLSFSVQAGDAVEKGQEIGLSGNTGTSTGPHLHFGMKLNRHNERNGYYGKTDPLPYLAGIARTSALTVKHIIWDVELAQGESITLGYQFRAPNLFPWLFLLGPLRLMSATDPNAKYTQHSATDSAGFVLGEMTDAGAAEAVYAEARQWQIASDETQYITGGSTWDVPSDWNNSNNSIEVIGGGGGGANGGNSLAASGGGGGGGAYSKAVNVTLTSGATVTVAVGTQGAIATVGGDTYVCNTLVTDCASIAGTAVKAGAKGGGGATGSTKGTGGQAGSGVGSTKVNGGDGGQGGTASGNAGGGGGGGGGAGGKDDAGNPGSTNTTTTGGTGGQGDGSSGGIGGNGGTGGNPGTPGDPGGNGSEWSTSYGSGGGGGGGGGGAATGNNGGAGGAGGSYGAGGGGGGSGGRNGTGASGNVGYQGLIVVQYTTGPTMAEVMRHGSWFSGGVEQAFTF